MLSVNRTVETNTAEGLGRDSFKRQQNSDFTRDSLQELMPDLASIIASNPLTGYRKCNHLLSIAADTDSADPESHSSLVVGP